MNRRLFLSSAISFGALAMVWPLTSCTDKSRSKGIPKAFFKLDFRKNHWWFITPEGEPFFTIGLDYIDPASLPYPENIHIWREKYQ